MLHMPTCLRKTNPCGLTCPYTLHLTHTARMTHRTHTHPHQVRVTRVLNKQSPASSPNPTPAPQSSSGSSSSSSPQGAQIRADGLSPIASSDSVGPRAAALSFRFLRGVRFGGAYCRDYARGHLETLRPVPAGASSRPRDAKPQAPSVASRAPATPRKVSAGAATTL